MNESKSLCQKLIAGIGELRFCLQWAFIHAPLSHVSSALDRLTC